MKNFNQDEHKLLSKYINDCKKYKIMSQSDVVDIYKKVEKNPELTEKYMKKIAEGNLRWVISIAKKYYNCRNSPYLSLLDLIGEGNRGLMIATQKYKVSLNLTFSNYAYWWIRQKIYRTLARHRSIAKIPYWVIEEKKSNINCPSISLDDENSLIYLKYKEDIYPKNEKINKVCIKKDVENILKVLNERERMIIKKRFGIDCYIPLTQKEIGKKIRKTGSRVKQIEAIAIDKIKAYVKKNKLEFYGI